MNTQFTGNRFSQNNCKGYGGTVTDHMKRIKGLFLCMEQGRFRERKWCADESFAPRQVMGKVLNKTKVCSVSMDLQKAFIP